MAGVRWSDFSGGDITPRIHARADLPRVQSGAKLMLNMFPTIHGAATKRPGLEWVGDVPIHDKYAKLIKFQFNIVQTYEILIQHQIAFVIKDGGFVVDPQATIEPASTTIEAITQFNVEIDVSGTTAGVHGLSSGDFVFLGALPAGYEEIAYRLFKVATIVSTSKFTITPIGIVTLVIQGAVASASGCDYKPLASFDLPYLESDLLDGDFDYAQSADDLYLVHPNHRPRKVTRTDHHVWTVSNFDASPSEPSPTNFAQTAAPTGSITIKYAVTAIDDVTKEESLATVLEIDNSSEPIGGSTPDPVDLVWDQMAGADKYRLYRSINGIFGLLNEVAYVTGITVTYQDHGERVPLLEIGPPIEVIDSFDVTDDYPGAVALFQQRIWFGRTNNNVIGVFASRSGSFESFAKEEILVDSSPIAQVVAGEGVHEVRWIVAARDLFIMTAAGEWDFDKGEQGAVTPSSGLRDQGDWGSAKVKPIKIGRSILFVEQSGRIVRDTAFELSADGFDGLDLSAVADHLFETASIVDWCYARKPYRLCFMVLSDGTAISLTYDKEQQVAGWARHTTAGSFESVVSVREGHSDNIYASIVRNGDNTTESRTVERMNMDNVVTAGSARYLDSWSQRPRSDAWFTGQIDWIMADPADGYRLKIRASIGQIRDAWPLDLEITDPTALAIFDELDGEHFVLIFDANPPEVTGGETWYTINRWRGGHPTWSTKADDKANMTLYTLVDKPLYPGDIGRNTGLGANIATAHLGSGEISHIRNKSYQFPQGIGADGKHFSPSYMLDDVFVREIGAMSWEDLDIDGADKAYSNMLVGYPYTARLDTLDVDSAEEIIDGSNVKTPEVVFRVHQSGPFKFSRTAQSQDPTLIDTVNDARYLNLFTWLFANAIVRSSALSVMDPRSGFSIISDEPYPLTVQSIALEVGIGNS